MKTNLILGIIFILGILLNCGGQSVKPARYGLTDNSCQILIAPIKGKTSDFKNIIIDSLVQRYKDQYSIEILPLESMKSLADKPYHVIIVMDDCQAGMRMNRSFKKNVDQLDTLKTILFITAGDKNWKYEYRGIEAVTSASELDRIDQVIGRLSQKIDQLLHVSR